MSPTMCGSAPPELGGTIYVSHGISAPPEAVVWAAVRPEKIFMSTGAAQDGTDNVVRGAVQDIAYLGDLSIYLVKLPTGKVVRVTQPEYFAACRSHQLGSAGVSLLGCDQPGGGDPLVP